MGLSTSDPLDRIDRPKLFPDIQLDPQEMFNLQEPREGEP